MIQSLKIFKANESFKNKRIAIVGAADSTFNERNGTYIDSFDIVIRVNKAPYSLDEGKIPFLGSKINYLFHSFHENNFSGGGPIDWELYNRLGIEKLINPNRSFKGLVTHLNFYKRHLQNKTTYIIARKNYKLITNGLEGYIPTIGFSALMLLLNSDCKELYITGFTFFRTPYAVGYRDELLNMKTNKDHISKQGIHNPELEFKLFKKALYTSKPKKVIFDTELNKIIGISSTL
ncbi:glycosyltransferase family 29 protein [Gillisia sp. JM1]|uniref:glycosyltransferase family 29 protein n=1 Tax=Gillisia sp. JM1 TaxID=1283286 RepID=UPI00040BA59F|nr:glycosyltransferase family 29 protein [Gillisia sp. JM1]